VADGLLLAALPGFIPDEMRSARPRAGEAVPHAPFYSKREQGSTALLPAYGLAPVYLARDFFPAYQAVVVERFAVLDVLYVILKDAGPAFIAIMCPALPQDKELAAKAAGLRFMHLFFCHRHSLLVKFIAVLHIQ
jgi:hypothetical protein